MFARTLAFVCLLNQFGLCSSLSGLDIPAKTPLVVFLKGTNEQYVDTLTAMRQEVRQLLEPAGYDVQFRSKMDASPVSGHLVVVEFKGNCHTEAFLSSNSMEREDLATTAVANGHILPFSQIHCTTVSRILAPTLSSFPSFLRDALFGRGLGRIIAHELYHVLADRPFHASSGIAKSSFSAIDLLSPHFLFEKPDLEYMSSEATSQSD